jgi:non-specific serine/threonine protein kinase
MPLAQPATASLQAVAENPSVRLFLERGRLVQPRLGVTPENAGAIVDLCRRLDGVPLAIELAAARSAVLAPAQLAVRLDRMLGVLTDSARTVPSRQRTLRATLDWSYDLLSPAERDLLHRLSVFVGGWTLEAAEAVGGAGDERAEPPRASSARGLGPSSFVLPAPAVLGLLAALVDKSLVQVEVDTREGARYRLLEPVRQYAAERLAAGSEHAPAHARHAAYFLALTEETEPLLDDGVRYGSLARLEREAGNLRAALGWYAARGDAGSGLRLAGALRYFWRGRDRAREGWAWLTQAFAAGVAPVAPLVRARAHYAASTIAHTDLGDFRAAREQAEAALTLFRAAGDQEGTCKAINLLGLAARGRGDLALAREHLTAALALARALADPAQASRSTAMVLVNLAGVAADAQDYRAAVANHAEALPLFRAVGLARGFATAASGLVAVRLLLGETDGLRDLLAESTAIFHEVGDRPLLALTIVIRALVALREGEPVLAAQLLGADERFRAAHRIPVTLTEAPHIARAVAAARAALGEAAFAAAWAAGRDWTLDEAVAVAVRP